VDVARLEAGVGLPDRVEDESPRGEEVEENRGVGRRLVDLLGSVIAPVYPS
jgi:hypothetical protein